MLCNLARRCYAESMLSKLFGLSKDSDSLVDAWRRADRQKFADLFGKTQIFCLSLPTGLENGIDPNVTQEELLAKIRAAAQDLSQRERFSPFCYTKNSQTRMPIFTSQELVQPFAHAYVRETKRIAPFQVLGVNGTVIARALGNADVIVLNDRTEHEYELTPDDIAQIRHRWL